MEMETTNSEDPLFKDGSFWYFWAETGDQKFGPFTSKEIAQTFLDEYIKRLNEE